jgi:hypothetical protein
MLNILKNYAAIFFFFAIFSDGIAADVYGDTPILKDIAVALARTRHILDPYKAYIDWVEEPVFDRLSYEERTKGKKIVVRQIWDKIVEISVDLLTKYKFSDIAYEHVLFCGDMHEVFMSRDNDDSSSHETILNQLLFSSKKEIEPSYLLSITSALEVNL